MHIVFGGSFNPPTLAHYTIVETLLQKFPEATVLIVPVGDDYQKPSLVSFFHRFEMLSLMFKDNDQVKIIEHEKKREYQGTLATLKELNQSYDHLHFVIGSDHLNQLDTWINYQELLASYPFIVMNRNHYMNIEDAEKLYQDLPHRFIFIEFSQDISSSEIRLNIEKYKDMIHLDVYHYILENNLYKEHNHG